MKKVSAMGDEIKYGVMICGHGSRSDSAVAEFAAMAEQLKTAFPDWPVEYGYLEFANPVIRLGLERLRAQGVNHILAVPGMLFAAGHVKNDIPSVLNSYAAEVGIKISYGRDLALSLEMLSAAADRIEAAISLADRQQNKISAEETCLVVIGRGASDPDANGNIAKVARMLWEGMGFGWCEIGYSGVTFPLVEPCLEHVVKLGYRRVIVFPYFLFSGILVDRIFGFTDRMANAHPDIQFVKADYLGTHPKVLTTFKDRVMEILEGMNHMDCSLCKYRGATVGFENEVGLAQHSHHHHVEGAGASAPGSNIENCQLCDDFCTGVCRLDQENHHDVHSHEGGDHHHDHAHHHHPYPRANHRLGPESLRKYLQKP